MSKSILYVVATPIGHLADISERALDTLRSVDFIAAEDTRHSKRLLNHYLITTPLYSLHEHNEYGVAEKMIERLRNGETAALISDAGTPLISDPGQHLVQQAHQANIKVVPIPGACALITALSVAGFAGSQFIFEGFLPPKTTAREQRLQQLAAEERTLVFYEAPHRIIETIAAMNSSFGGERLAMIARELTKTFETLQQDTLTHLQEWLAQDANQRKGEFVIIVKGAEKKVATDIDPETLRLLQILKQELPTKQAVALAAKITGVRKNQLYQLSLSGDIE